MSRAGQAGTADVVGMPNSLTDRLSDCLTEGRTDRLTEAQAGLHTGHFQVLCTLKALLLLLLLPGRFNKVSAAQTLIPFIKKLFICQFLPFSCHYAVMLPIVVHIAKFHSASRSNSSSRSISRFQWHPFRIFLALFLYFSTFFLSEKQRRKNKKYDYLLPSLYIISHIMKLQQLQNTRSLVNFPVYGLSAHKANWLNRRAN